MAGWKSVEEIIAYQVSRELRRQVLTATRTGPASKDYDFRRQIRDSARSAPRNLAEGFTRYNHGEFAYHTNVAKASLAETVNHLQDGFEEDYFSKDAYERMNRLAVRALKACTGLLRHLQTSQAPPPYWSQGVEQAPRRRNHNAPSSDSPSTHAPSTHAPSTDAPSTDAPSTHTPSSHAPSTHAPSTHAPSTDAPSTDAPSTDAPSTDARSTDAPSTRTKH